MTQETPTPCLFLWSAMATNMSVRSFLRALSRLNFGATCGASAVACTLCVFLKSGRNLGEVSNYVDVLRCSIWCATSVIFSDDTAFGRGMCKSLETRITTIPCAWVVHINIHGGGGRYLVGGVPIAVIFGGYGGSGMYAQFRLCITGERRAATSHGYCIPAIRAICRRLRMAHFSTLLRARRSLRYFPYA